MNIDSPEYPATLKDAKDPPKELHVLGKMVDFSWDNLFAVLGSRRPSIYAQRVTRRFCRELTGAGFTIVSGFMYGIDALAHKSAVESGGQTLAVLAQGVDVVSPEYQRNLYEDILVKGGIIVSELPLGTQPQKWTFPRRNRIVVGLSQGVFIPDAAEGSGTMLSAQLAIEMGRPLFVLPHNSDSGFGFGCNELIKQSKARLVTEPSDILTYFFENSGEKRFNPERLGAPFFSQPSLGETLSFTMKIYECILQNPGISVEGIAEQYSYSLTVGDILQSLSEMEIMGNVFESRGGYYVDKN